MNSIKDLFPAEPGPQKSLRLLPGVLIVALQWLIRFGIPSVLPGDGALMMGVFGGILGGIAVIIWWTFFSRAPKAERWGATVLIIVSLLATSQFLDKSISTGAMGLMFIIVSIPVMSLVFVVWAVLSSRLSGRLRRSTMVVTILLASGVWILIRSDGMSGHLHFDYKWRWAESQEDRFLAQNTEKPEAIPGAAGNGASWPGFRGPDRNAVIHGVNIKTDWKKSPPVEQWRRKIGPGCSSFAVTGKLLYTQEQRGEYEAVTCYSLTTGKPVWVHEDKTRFWDSHAGAGPRGTPTLSGERIYTFGATGILNVLNAGDGTLIWSRNVASDTGEKVPGWGFTSSPLIVDSMVVVAASGNLAAYDLTSGRPHWFGPDSCKGYSSPHLLTIGGIPQILETSDVGTISLKPGDGKLLWEDRWPTQDRILQPAQTEEGDILFSSATKGIRRIAVVNESDGWKVKERWTSAGMRPNFNDFVIHKGHIYGFDGLALACVSLDNGKRIWRGGRYGGQIILLADQDLILVLSEKGELAIVAASPDKFTELASFQAIEGKTWNHPVLAGDILIVRNSQEMAAFRLALADAD
jgi:outer membrane protein assembly factor BamB